MIDNLIKKGINCSLQPSIITLIAILIYFALFRLHNGSLYNTSPVGDSMEHLVQTARDNFRNMWASANIRLNPEVQETDGTFHTAQEQVLT